MTVVMVVMVAHTFVLLAAVLLHGGPEECFAEEINVELEFQRTAGAVDHNGLEGQTDTGAHDAKGLRHKL